MSTISDILEQVRAYSPDADLQPIMQAYLMAAKAHAGQTRKSGEPYLSHPLAVAYILAEMKMDVETIATALLHDALEDNPITAEEMSEQIGPVITQLVDGVTKIGKLKFRSKEELQAENFRKMMLAMSKDLRVILVKIADRLHNMSTLGFHGKAEKQARIAQETMEIFVPIASRLGLDRIKGQLQELCFRYLHPSEYESVHAFLDSTQSDRDCYINEVVLALEDQLTKDGVDCDVKGRAKHPYSIYKKMVSRHLSVEEVPDLLAFRVLVDSVGSCYAVLGLIHANFTPIEGRIKDYIARPKPNGYQSLHTTIMGPKGRRVEVQIRTREMHRVAEEGIAAHWKYKEGHLAISPDEVSRISKLRDVFEDAQDAETADDFMAAMKVEFYSDAVFVFTPAGDVKQFPVGATSLDFAYAVHTDVGNRCTGARVDGRMVPLRYELQSGDRVEILTSPKQRPSRDWLSIVRTGRAIQKIRRTLREEELERGKVLGKEMLEAELKRFEQSLTSLHSDGSFNDYLKKKGFRTKEQLFSQIAIGHLSLGSVLKDLLPKGVYITRNEQEAAQGTIGSLLNRIRKKSESPVLISGEDGVLVSFAHCCTPLPGEKVAGFITRGKGITVHHVECKQLKTLEQERLIAVEWDRDANIRHTSQLKIYCSDRPGLLANISKVCEVARVNILGVQARSLGNNRALCTFELAIHDVEELTRLVSNIKKISDVESVERATS